MKQFCKYGHDTLVVGRTSNRTCKTCTITRLNEWQLNNLDKYHAARKLWILNNPERHKATFKRCHAKKKAERIDFLAKFKNKPCADCQGWFEPCQMDFDHRDPTAKIASISKMGWDSRALVRIKEEIRKCDLVCANCHRLRTRRQYAN